MKNNYIFRQIRKEEIPLMFHLILQRMKWMDTKGIKQWNVTSYDKIYPRAYYEEAHANGTVFVLEDISKKEIVCAAVLKEQDNRWNGDTPALYLHNFVSKIDEHGVGAVFLRMAEEYAVQKKKQYFRLDSSKDNDALGQYYESQGYNKVGTCEDGAYKGILRQKKLGR